MPGLALLAVVAVPLYAWRVRGRNYAAFGAVVLLLSMPGAVVTHALLRGHIDPELRPWLDALFLAGLASAVSHLSHLVQARLRSPAFRILVSIPGQVFVAAGFLATFWQLALLPLRLGIWLFAGHAGGAWMGWLDAAPLLLASVSVVTSLRGVPEWVRVPLARSGPEQVERVPVDRHRWREPSPLARRPLRVVQITDPHLGPWQPVARLRRRIEALLARDPDLVLLTGDFLTMEGQGSPGALSEALRPLQSAAGRCYAIFGNHDHEALDEVRSALEENQVTLLVDDEALAETPIGPVQILGADYVRRGQRKHLEALLARFPRREGYLRLLLLHDPLGFQHVPDGEADLTLSGHTHGGQVGLVSLGLDWTVLTRSRWPDHGLFARGSNRLYVHRGTGFYGFPLRVGVPGEHSVLELILP
jgi:predicted MPP superfamily phosphohydrolase